MTRPSPSVAMPLDANAQTELADLDVLRAHRILTAADYEIARDRVLARFVRPAVPVHGDTTGPSPILGRGGLWLLGLVVAGGAAWAVVKAPDSALAERTGPAEKTVVVASSATGSGPAPSSPTAAWPAFPPPSTLVATRTIPVPGRAAEAVATSTPTSSPPMAASATAMPTPAALQLAAASGSLPSAPPAPSAQSPNGPPAAVGAGAPPSIPTNAGDVSSAPPSFGGNNGVASTATALNEPRGPAGGGPSGTGPGAGPGAGPPPPNGPTPGEGPGRAFGGGPGMGPPNGPPAG